jgi:hypothetical protein
MNLKIIITLIMLCVFVNISYAECTLAHTHIGVNPTWRPSGDPDTSDDNQLWFFSLPGAHPGATPDWPVWGTEPGASTKPFLKLVPDLDDYGNAQYKPGDFSKQLYTCDFMWSKANGYGDPLGTPHLDGWHSAHPGHGMWNLASVDEQTPPDWDIYLKREGVSTNLLEDDFFMLTPNEQMILTTDGSNHNLLKQWLPDKVAWGLHEHMAFEFYLDEAIGDVVSVTFSAYDDGGMYTASDDFTMEFEVVPEPATLSLLALGCVGLLRRHRK